jgi:ATP-dependent helicase/DNAse subunit B
MNFVLEAYTLSECMELMAERVEKYELEGRKNFIFCEDRLTLIAERALTRRTGGTFLSSVTTFARFLKTEEKIISKQGSVMAVGGIMASLQKAKALRCFTSPSAIENSAKVVYETIAQLAASEVTPDTLQESATLLEGDVLKDKVCDLALIYREYSAFLVEKGYLDESKYLSLLPDRIRAESSLRGANIIFLGFTSFTAQALKSVRAAIETAKDVVGIFCAGEEEIYTNRARDVFLRTCEEYAKAEIRKLGTQAFHCDRGPHLEGAPWHQLYFH